MKSLQSISVIVFLIAFGLLTSSNNCSPTAAVIPEASTVTSPAVDPSTNTALNVALIPTLAWKNNSATTMKLTYNIYLSSIAPPTKLLVKDYAQTSYTLTRNLETNMQYYWKVVAKNTSTKDSTSSDIYSFTTLQRVESKATTKTTLAMYSVANRKLTLTSGAQNDVYNKIWDQTVKIIPNDIIDSYVKVFELFNKSTLAGQVSYTDNQSIWTYSMSTDISFNANNEFDTDGQATYTIIHEFAHIISLIAAQVDITVAKADCPSYYYSDEFCSKSDSYFNKLYNDYWKSVMDDYTNDNKNFYTKYKTQFVTKYATTNIKEDFAEIFTHFVIRNDQPTASAATIADRKIAMLYTYPALTDLRTKIRTALGADNLKSLNDQTLAPLGLRKLFSSTGDLLLTSPFENGGGCGYSKKSK